MSPEFPADPRNDLPPSRLQLPPGPWPTLLDGLCARFPAIPRAIWIDRFARGRVQAHDGTPLAPDLPWRTGLDIRYFREVPHEAPIAARERVLHIDAHLLVVDKPHGLPVVPSGGYVRETLLARLVASTGNADLAPLHRLDRDTAGLVLFSTQPATRDAYQSLFREHRIGKHYEAIAPTHPALAFPHVHRSRLVPGEPFFRMRETDGPPNSETHIDVLERGETFARYALAPVTGRKHQLRVHMASLGIPIRNDAWYPDLVDAAPDARPLQLLACALDFTDPLDSRPRQFRSTLQLHLATPRAVDRA